MKKIKLLVVLFGLTFAVSCGQQKRYVSYKMQKGDTIENIADRLKMSKEDLLRLNPDISNEPGTNTVIIIPNKKLGKTKTESVNEDATKDTGVIDLDENTNPEENTTNDKFYTVVVTDYETHTVKQGETVYRITKEYNITKDELIRLNPEFPDIVFNNLSVGQVLKVKEIINTIEVDKEEILKNYVTHTVKSKETVYSLTRFYNISKDDLIALNPEYPEIKNNVLKVGQLIKIRPKNEEEEKFEYKFYQDSITEDASINLALLLPFRASEYDSLNSREIFRKNRLANMVTDYYLGAEMAIDSLKNQGVTVNVSIFDTGKKSEKIEAIIENNDLDDNDVILGPFYSEEAVVLSKEVKAPIVFPHFSSKQRSFSSKNLVKTSPDKDSYTGFLLNYLKEIYNGETVFVIGDDTKESNTEVLKIKNSLSKLDSVQGVHVLKPKDGYIKKERYTEKLKENAKTWVIVTSADNVVVADALNSAIGLPDGTSVQVFAVSKDKAYERIDNNKLASVNFTYVSDIYSNSDSEELSIFNEKFLEKNNALPSDYAIKGFDTTYDVLMRLASGEKLLKTFKEGISFRLENKFDYRKKFGVYSNQGLYIVKYNKNLNLTRLK